MKDSIWYNLFMNVLNLNLLVKIVNDNSAFMIHQYELLEMEVSQSSHLFEGTLDDVKLTNKHMVFKTESGVL